MWSDREERVWLAGSPAHKVADDIGMADQYLVTVFLLRRRGSVEIAAEGSLDTRTLLEEILEQNRQTNTHQD